MNRHVSWRSTNFPNILQSGDQENTKNFIQDLDIAWASKPVEVDLATLS